MAGQVRNVVFTIGNSPTFPTTTWDNGVDFFFFFVKPRGMDFAIKSMKISFEQPDYTLTKSFQEGYGKNLSKQHNIVTRQVAQSAMNALPSKDKFYPKLAQDVDQMKLEGLEWSQKADAVLQPLLWWIESMKPQIEKQRKGWFS